MRAIKDSMERKRGELDVKQAKADAEAAEDDALVTLGFVSWAIEHAEAAVLDAIDARSSGRFLSDQLRWRPPPSGERPVPACWMTAQG